MYSRYSEVEMAIVQPCSAVSAPTFDAGTSPLSPWAAVSVPTVTVILPPGQRTALRAAGDSTCQYSTASCRSVWMVGVLVTFTVDDACAPVAVIARAPT